MIIIQARLNSTRLPLKILKKINKKRINDHVVSRCTGSGIGPVVIATPDPLQVKNAVVVQVGNVPEWDVAARFARVLRHMKPEAFIRVCADSPFLPSSVIRDVWDARKLDDCDYVFTQGFVSGHQAEAFKTSTFLKEMDSFDRHEREHLGLYFRNRLEDFSHSVLVNDGPQPPLKMSVDTEEDLGRIKFFVSGREHESGSNRLGGRPRTS